MSHNLLLFRFYSLVILLTNLSPTYSTLINSIDDLLWTEDNRLQENYILYPQSSCNLNLGTSYVKETPVSDDFFENWTITKRLSLSPPSIPQCVVVGLLQGTLKDYIYYPLLEHIYLEGETTLSYKQWITNFHKKEIGWMSEHPDTFDIYYYDSDGNNVIVASLSPHETNTLWLDTYIGHTFRVVNPITDEIIDDILVKYDCFHSYFVDNSTSHLKNLNHVEEVLHGIDETLHYEFNRSLNVTRTFTPLGFHKGVLPRYIYSSMLTYYNNNRDAIYVEDWMDMFHVNWWEVNALMIGMPWKLKRYWQTKLRFLVEKWIGGNIPLENSDIYGMRRYESDAWLLSHVDRESTHAVSLIINLEQQDMEKDWMVEIYDHAGRLHEIPMEPGEIIFYESAKNLHGRMTPLKGRSYANIFSHYRPIGDSEWYLKPNPPDTPPPILDLDESFQLYERQLCSLIEGASSSPSPSFSISPPQECVSPDESTYEQRKQQWMTQTVPYLSIENGTPTSIQNGDDLFNYWKKVNEIS